MPSRLGTVMVLIGIGIGLPLGAQLPSFPGAEGFGASATGGRGGRVVYVTNLSTSGPGSFQSALDETGPRYILFKVSGLVDGSVHLASSDVTIAGQTSPGGIVVRGFHTTEDPYVDQIVGRINDPDVRHADNWILRHLRIRPAGAGLDDGLRMRYTRNAIVDHCSVANASDEAIEVSFSSDITIQNTILAETLGAHADLGGMLINYSNPADGFPLDRISLHHDNWNRLGGREPEISRESTAAAGTFMDIEIASNLLWDPGFFIAVAQLTGWPDSPQGSYPVYYHFNWVGNRVFARTDFPYGAIWLPVNDPNLTTIYFSDDTMNLYPERQDYGLNYCCNDYAATTVSNDAPSYARSTRHPFPSVTYTPSASVTAHVLANAGAFPRDPMDRRLLAPLRTGVIDPAPRSENPYGDAFAHDWVTPPPPPLDTDGDGMPDAWETARGRNPSVQDHNGTDLSAAGYTNLEVYLNELADRIVSRPLSFYTLAPCRVLDTRDPDGAFGGPRIPAEGIRSFALAGRCGVPTDATAVCANVTAVNPLQPGFATLYEAGSASPSTSSVSFPAGRVRASNAIAAVSTDGTASVAVHNGSAAPLDVIVDVNGYFR